MLEVIGHRGAKGLAPENSLESLNQAIECRVDAVEFDVRTTSDCAVVLHHDPKIAGLTIRKHTLKELLAANQDLLALSQALRFLEGRLPLVIDIKKDCDLMVLARELNKSPYKNKIILASKHPAILRRLKDLLPSHELALQESFSGLRATFRARRLGINRLHFQARGLWPGFIKSLSRRGWHLYAYTVNSPSKARRWHEAGLVGVFTDRPDKF